MMKDQKYKILEQMGNECVKIQGRGVVESWSRGNNANVWLCGSEESEENPLSAAVCVLCMSEQMSGRSTKRS